MATTAVKAPYDPIKALEGMFNGSVTRVAHALKDPSNYGLSTKTVLAECAKRFQDALDDCEIQLLDAKWYLEHQLAQNKARREAKEKESSSAAAKRKHEDLQETNLTKEAENAAKRARTEQEKSETQGSSPQPQPKPAADAVVKIGEESKSIGAAKEPQKPVQDETAKAEPEKAAQEQSSADNEKAPELKVETQVPTDDFAKPTPHDTPINTNDDFNFESMFDHSVDGNDPTNDDMNLDFGLGDGFLNDSNNTNNMNQDQSSLNSLLPELESYANQMGNDMNNPSSQLPTFSNNFDLPDLGDSNTFDDFLNDDNLGTTNFEGNVDLTDEAFHNMSFDDMFDGEI